MNGSLLRFSSPIFLVAGALAVGIACHAEPDDPNNGQKNGNVPRKAAPAAPPCSANADPALDEPFKDDFERGELGEDNWHSTSYGAYYIKGGKLCSSKPRNHPTWLRRRLPDNVKVEFDATPQSGNADVKAEIFGDGCAFDTAGGNYTSTGYVAVLGAHNNTEHWLVRLFEHGADAKKTPLVGGTNIATSKLMSNSTYHVVLSRSDGKTLQLAVDGVTVHTFEDAHPLAGPGHDHFGFNGWEPPVCFDNLLVTPIAGGAPSPTNAPSPTPTNAATPSPSNAPAPSDIPPPAPSDTSSSGPSNPPN
jgi:hypothetical protein